MRAATAGSGLTLYEQDDPARHCELISARPFKSGVVYPVYRPDPNLPSGRTAKEQLPRDRGRIRRGQ